jgi:hypothetical protein
VPEEQSEDEKARTRDKPEDPSRGTVDELRERRSVERLV